MQTQIEAQTVVERQAIRAILLTPAGEVLLMRIRPPDGTAPFWITPGGGLEAGEDSVSGLRRELMEELGLTDFVIGPIVWLRRHTFNWADKRICQHEQYHIVHVNRFVPVITDEAEAKTLDRFQWWQADDLIRSQERLTPLSLAAIVNTYISHGPPHEALAVEVLMD